MLDFLNEKKDCTGCGACMNICPKACISMEPDEEGFKYPVVDKNTCISCGLCEKVCPSLAPDKYKMKLDNPIAFAGLTKDETVWRNSASGGAFTEICNAFSDTPEELVIFGCENNNSHIKHSYVIGVENIGKFRRSKYVQSDMELCYKQAKEFLAKNKKVVFSGTPCHIAGLRSFLRGKQYDNLLCVAVICHGVGSPQVFSDHITYLKKKLNNGDVQYEFRHKKIFGRTKRTQHRISKISYGDQVQYVELDEYNRCFYRQLILRPSCSTNCKYRSIERNEDITIADFHGFSYVFPNVRDFHNRSAIVINTEKGVRLIEKLRQSMYLLDCDIESIKKYNPLICRSTAANPLRDSFFQEYAQGTSYEKLVNKYAPVPKESIKQRMIKLISKILYKEKYF